MGISQEQHTCFHVAPKQNTVCQHVGLSACAGTQRSKPKKARIKERIGEMVQDCKEGTALLTFFPINVNRAMGT